MINKFLTLLSLFILCLAQTLRAQETTPATTTAPATATTATSQPATQPTSPIPLAQVVTQSDSIKGELRAATADLVANPIVDTIKTDLPPLTTDITTHRSDTTQVLAANPSLETLSSEETAWQTLAETLDAWKRDLTARAQSLDSRHDALQHQLDTWQQVLAAAKTSDVPPEVLNQIQTTLGMIDDARAQAQTRRSEVLVLQSQVAAQSDQVATALTTLRDSREQVIKHLFVRDARPIWSLQFHNNPANTHRTSWTARFDALIDYLERAADRFALQGILLVVFAILLFWARSRFNSWLVNEPSLTPAAAVFKSPISAALVLVTLLSLWLHPEAPRLFWSIAAAIVIIPATLLIRRLLNAALAPLLYALVSFFFIDQFRSAILGYSPWPRLAFLAEMLAAVFFFLWFILSRRKPPHHANSRHMRLILACCSVASAFFAVAFFLNALGFGRLSFLLGSAMLRSAYLALILYSTLAIADGLVIILLHLRLFARLSVVRNHSTLLRARARLVLTWAAACLWIYLSLRLLYVVSPVFDAVTQFLTTPLHLGGFVMSLGQILSCIIAIWASFALSRFIRFLLQEDIYPHLRLPRGLGNAFSTIIHYAVLLIGFGIAIAVLGFPMTQFTILTGAFGVGLGFGLQTIINNFFSGIIVLAERPIQVGDVIEMDGIAGTVVRIGIRATVMRTPEGSEIILPNARLVSERVINWTLSDRKRGFEIPLNIDAAADPARIIQLLQDTARACPNVAPHPAPCAQIAGLSAVAFNVTLRVWATSIDDWKQVRSDVTLAARAALLKENIALK